MSKTRPCILDQRTRRPLGLLSEPRARWVALIQWPLALLLLWCSRPAGLAEDAVTNAPSAAMVETNTQEILRAYLQLQEQLHLTQLAIEQNRKEARETAAQTAEVLAGRLQAIEQALEAQRARELETMQSSNRVLLIIAGTFASVGFVAMLLMSFFQWRTVNRLAQLPAAWSHKELTAGDGPSVSVGPVEQSSLRLLGAMEQLEKRLLQLEHTTRTPLGEETRAADANASTGAGENGHSHEGDAHGQPTNGLSPETNRVMLLLGKGQSMLNLEDAPAAISCFDEALALEPQNAEAWVRKGTALERLQQLDQAIECYDRAIEVDQTLTIAYLHKGGLFNRLERFNEALECYEKALRTQEKRHA
jgi:tetratricopeptide (TPR) repeat protein